MYSLYVYGRADVLVD